MTLQVPPQTLMAAIAGSILSSGVILSGLAGLSPALAQVPSGQTPTPTQPQSTSAQWAPFQSEQGGFSISMPGKPLEQVQKLDTAGGAINTYLYSIALENGAIKYTVSYLDLPKEAESLPENLVLEAIMGGIAGDTRSKVLSERMVTLDKFNGREIKIESQQQSIVWHRAYLVKQRIYQIAVEVPTSKEKTLSDDVNRFFNSFKLL